MADTLTPNIKLTNQTEGGNNNTWGTIVDANFEEIDDKFGDTTEIVTTGGDTTLSDAQEIVAVIDVSGTLVSNAAIIFSGRGGTWIIRNDTTGSFSVTCKVSGQTGVVIEQGGAALVFCDGTDIDLGNPPSAEAAEVTVASVNGTTEILGAASEFIAISGTNTITGFGTGANRKRFVRATGAFLITHHGTTLICPGGQNIRAASGDTFIVISDSSSNCRIYCYQRAAAPPQGVPIGGCMDYAGSSAPAFWLFYYGQAISRTTYAAAFAVLDVTHGVGDGSTTFNLPDGRGRVVAGKDDMGGSSANRLTGLSGGVNGDVLGAAGGSESHTLTTAQLSSHTHTGTTASNGAHTHTTAEQTSGAQAANGAQSIYRINGSSTTSSDGAHTHTFTSDAAGSGSAHNNVQPTLVLNKIIFVGV